MLEILLAVKYFRRPNRPLWHKVGVGIFLAADTTCTISICSQVYLVLLVFPCVDVSGVFLKSLYWPISITILSTYTTASVEQAFLCYLFYSLTKRRVVTGLLVFTIFLHLGFSWASAGLVLTQRGLGGMAFVATVIGAVSCAVTDVLLAAMLGFTFYTMESSVVRGRTTHGILRRLGVISLTSGVIVASITLIAVITLMLGNSIYSLFFFCQGRAYALTILGNFLFGLPVDSEQDPAPQKPARRTNPNPTGVVFHVDYRTESLNTNNNHQESMNLEELGNKAVRAHPD
ncbi:hypothetical protein C8R47DRAFT_1210014 [Mycena vitilis]|nr:hypothetical protein C8R47DRAFT_1210014 [Mycena vitilis]